MRRLLAVLLLALAAAPAALAGPWQFVPASPRNYPHGYRPGKDIRMLVVHVIEGTAAGAVSWFRNPRARVSAHYVVDRDGTITQMVADTRAAWHAGNGYVNRHSLGVENEGYTGIPWTFTDAEYRGSARLAASLMRHYLLPIDRSHLIGHNEVRDPFRPWLRGGFGHHTDPGRYWDWTRYLSYVRAYAVGNEPPLPAIDVTLPSLRLLQSVSGTAWIEAEVADDEPAARVDFLLDGKLRETVTEAPFLLSAGAWDTTAVSNGRHVLTARAVGADGRTANATALLDVSNAPLKVTALNLVEGQTVAGLVHVETATSRPPQRVEIVVDGVVVATLTAAPYAFDWDTTKEIEGGHLVTVRAVVKGYAVAARSAFVVVAQPVPLPPEPPAPATP